jgi:putative component of toxin-antitoxin plasmid stabilization module
VLDVREYIDTAGRSPFTKWLRALNVQAAAKVATALERIAAGNHSNVKTVGNGVLEYRLILAPATEFTSGGTATGLLFCSPAVRRSGSRNMMPLTKDFRETIRERAQQEPRFRRALLREAIELMLSGDEKTGRAILRNYINATVGFRHLEEATSIPANSLMRMFGPNGNPSAKNLFGVLAHLQAQEGVNFEIRPRHR